MYISRATKFKPRPPPSPSGRRYLEESKKLAIEFCDNTSIHGVKYFVGSNRALIEKVWWIVVFLLSLYGCGRLIQTVYMKWDREPVIVTFAQKPTPVFQIPFPAVTICPETKVKAANLNFTKTYYYSRFPLLRKQLTDDQLNKLLAMLQVCEFAFSDQFDNQTYDDDCVSLLKEMSIPQDEIFVVCSWRTSYENCSTDFRLTLTDVGFCYTFNSIAGDDLLRTDQLHSDFEYIAETRSTNWTLHEGYPPGTDIDTYPRRVLGAGIKAGVAALIKANESDLDYLCGNSFQGFKVLLHMPNEYPQLLNQHFRVPLNQEVAVSVTPRMIITSESIQSYKPNRRQCFFNNERYLKFFKDYTQSNCELECLANFTLRRCGCVKFSMPRSPKVKICGVTMEKCYEIATVELLEMEVKYRENPRLKNLDDCNCLPSCTSVQYNTEISQASFEWKRLLPVVKTFGDSLKGVQVSYLIVFFKDAQFIPVKRSELFGLTDFLANCGGLLGLFMGVSILSLVEIFYYCIIKPLVMWCKARKPEKEQPQVQVKTVSSLAEPISIWRYEGKM
nr:pickpocket protein 28-like [Aedes albopictus]